MWAVIYLTALSSLESGDNSGLVGMTWFDAGSRSFYATRDLDSPDSLTGLKIRVMQDPVAEATVKALGASAVTMSYGELYTSLKQGGVDGAENNPPSFYSSRHFEVCKNYLLDEHSRIPDVLVAGTKFWDGLNDVEKQWVRRGRPDMPASFREICGPRPVNRRSTTSKKPALLFVPPIPLSFKG